MKKAVVTLNIGDYEPEITKITYPFLKGYAQKIGAEFIEITERKFPDWPASAEKFQLHEIAPQFEHCLFVDADAFIAPDTPDLHEMFNDKSVVFFNGLDNRLDRFKADIYSRRSGSRVGACTWLVGCTDWTAADLWQPPADFDAAVKNISLMWSEAKTGQCQHAHLIDDYQLSCNIARYGLKVKSVNGLCEELRRNPEWFVHLYNCSSYEKLRAIRARLDAMGVAYP